MATNQLVRIGGLLADRTRTEILTTLMDGRAYTGSELARHVGVAPSTASEHLTKLLEAGMVAVEAAGRHRYFRLHGPEIAELLESLGATRVGDGPGPARPSTSLAYARTCYDHLAGEIAVAIYDQVVRDGHLNSGEGSVLAVSACGAAFFGELGVDLSAVESTRRPRARRCLDWTQRRHHLGGSIGAALLTVMLAKGWLVRGSRPRSIKVTQRGRREIEQRFGLASP